MTIRPFDPARDAAALLALVLEVNPVAVQTETSLAQRLAAVPERARLQVLVAEEAGEVVGRVEPALAWYQDAADVATCNVAVRASHRGRGIGSELLRLGLEHVTSLGARTVLADFVERPGGLGFAERHGFHVERAETIAVVDPRAVEAEPPAGVDLRPVAALDPRLVYLLDEETTRDMPQTGTRAETPFEDWRREVLEHPLLALDGSFVAFADGEPAALSFLTADRASGRALNWFTGTRAAHRGRGYARAVKLASTRWAAANGIVQIATMNDETNAPMLAVNRRLGYRPVGRRLEVARELRC